MIEPMKKLTLLALAADQDNLLESLRNLGAMHLSSTPLVESTARTDAQATRNRIEKLLLALSEFKTPKHPSGRAGGETLAEGDKLLTRREELTRKVEQLTKDAAQLAIWGDFDRRTLGQLAAKGIKVYLCEGTLAQYKEWSARKDCTVELVKNVAGCGYFAVVSQAEIAQNTLPLAVLPQGELTLKEIQALLAAGQNELQQLGQKLQSLAAELPELQKLAAGNADEIALLSARDSLSKHGAVVTLAGFIPAKDFEQFERMAKSQGWAYVANDAERNNPTVPTLVKMPKWVRIVEPLFEFLGIAPGYNEHDVSPVVLIFFTIFFGILVGDAGYGLVFLATTLPLVARTKGKTRTALGLVAILSVSAVVWGALTNNYFGVSFAALDALQCDALATGANKDANVQYLCFILGVIQLSIGHFWRMLANGHWRNVGSQIGWLAMMIANFLLIRTMIVYPGSTSYPEIMPYLYIGGIALVAVCEVNWLDPGSILGFPFSLINSFVDLLSYIRLFAVGMAGYYLAYSFNGIAHDLMTSFGGWIAAILLLGLGHALNIGLAVLSVLVHGVRLNTLEFSSHIGLQWTGINFKPFRKHNKN